MTRIPPTRLRAMQREADRLRAFAIERHIILIYDPTCGTAPEAYDQGEAILAALERYSQGDRTEATLQPLYPLLAGYNHLHRAKVTGLGWQAEPSPEVVAWAIATGQPAY